MAIRLAPCACGHERRSGKSVNLDGERKEVLTCLHCGKAVTGKDLTEAVKLWNDRNREGKRDDGK